jgi:hypothetical protein
MAESVLRHRIAARKRGLDSVLVHDILQILPLALIMVMGP